MSPPPRAVDPTEVYDAFASVLTSYDPRTADAGQEQTLLDEDSGLAARWAEVVEAMYGPFLSLKAAEEGLFN